MLFLRIKYGFVDWHVKEEQEWVAQMNLAISYVVIQVWEILGFDILF